MKCSCVHFKLLYCNIDIRQYSSGGIRVDFTNLVSSTVEVKCRPTFYLYSGTEVDKPVGRVDGGRHELLRSVRAELVLREEKSDFTRAPITDEEYIQNRVYEHVDSMRISGRDGTCELLFGAPTGRDGTLLVKLAQVPL